MKKWIVFCCVIVTLLCMTACQSEEAPSIKQEAVVTTTTTDAITSTTTTTVSTDPVESDNGEEQIPGSTPLFYQVTDDDGDTVWLLGTIHVAKEDMYPLPSYIYDAYDNASALAVECDVLAFQTDFAAMTDMMTAMTYAEGEYIYDHISEELYEEAKSILKEGNYYLPMFDRYNISMWSSLIDTIIVENLGYKSDIGIDMHFLNRAHDENKPIIEIESVEFQTEMFNSFSPELQVLLLESSVESYHAPETSDMYNEMVEIWSTGDETRFEEFLATEDDGIETEEELILYEEYNKKLALDRNVTMTDFAEDCLENGEDVFICVGAAHIVGDHAMVDLLRERGFTVELIRE